MRVRTITILVFANLLFVSSLIWFYPSTSDFRCDNPFWNGLSEARASFNILEISSITELPEEVEGVALLLIPYTPIEDWEIGLLSSFLKRGGVLIVMDDYGYGGDLLRRLGIRDLLFTHELLLDPLFCYRNPKLPRAIRFSPEFHGVKDLALNHASTLEASGTVEVLAWSSSFSYLDQDGDLEHDDGEPMGGFAVAARLRVGEGWLIAVSDPSILINSMIDLYDNKSFFERLLEIHGVEKVFLDVSHLPTSRLDRAKSWLREAYVLASSPGFSIPIITLMLIASLSPIWFEELRGLGGAEGGLRNR